MSMTPPLRKLALTAHVSASVGWLGALAVFLAHALASLVSQDAQMVRAATLAMALTAWFVILPLSVASLVTGLIQACDLVGLRTSLMVHAAGGLPVLLAAATLAVYKPAGMTRYGARKEMRPGSGSAASTPRTPRWVKVFKRSKKKTGLKGVQKIFAEKKLK